MQPRNLTGGEGSTFTPMEPANSLIQVGLEHMPRQGSNWFARVTNGTIALKNSSEGKYEVATAMTPFIWTPHEYTIRAVREQFAHWEQYVTDLIYDITKDKGVREEPVVPITPTGLEMKPRPTAVDASGLFLHDQKIVAYNDFLNQNFIVEDRLFVEIVNKLQASIFNTLYTSPHNPSPIPVGLGKYHVPSLDDANKSDTLPLELTRRPGMRVRMHNSEHELVWDYTHNSTERMQAKMQSVYQVWMAVAMDYLFDFPIYAKEDDVDKNTKGLIKWPSLGQLQADDQGPSRMAYLGPSRSAWKKMTFMDVIAIAEEFKAQYTGYGNAEIKDDITAYDVMDQVKGKIGIKHSVADRDAYADLTKRLIFDIVFGLVTARMPARAMDMQLIRKNGQWFTIMKHLENHINAPYQGGSLTTVYRPMTRLGRDADQGKWTVLPAVCTDMAAEEWVNYRTDPIVPSLMKVEKAELPEHAITTDRANPKLTSLVFQFPTDARILELSSTLHNYYIFRKPTWHYRYASSMTSPLSRYQLLLSYFSAGPASYKQAFAIPYDPEGRLTYVKNSSQKSFNIIEKELETLTDGLPMSDGTNEPLNGFVTGPVEGPDGLDKKPLKDTEMREKIDDTIKVADE